MMTDEVGDIWSVIVKTYTQIMSPMEVLVIGRGLILIYFMSTAVLL